MRVALLSDTHMPRGGRALPPRCVELLRGADAILHAGDFVASSVLDDLRALGPPVHAVHGNVDASELKAMLPERTTVELAGVRIGIVHDPGPARDRLGRLRAQFPDAQAVIFGHTHIPQRERDGDFEVFNPGSPTERRRAPTHTMGLATIEGGRATLELVHLS